MGNLAASRWGLAVVGTLVDVATKTSFPKRRRLSKVMRHYKAVNAPVRSAHLTVRVQRDPLDGGWVAEVIQLPGCMSQGETREEAVENVMEAFREILVAQAMNDLEESSNRTHRADFSFDVPVGAF
jgi:predicted RNase H-like HicB family nuclease